MEPIVEWDKRQHETAAEYSWFQRYVEVGYTRTPARAAARCGISTELCKQAAMDHDWKMRAAAYDQFVEQLRAQHVEDGDEQSALAMQYAAGEMMLRMGINALSLKNISLLKIKDIQAMTTQGAEMMRRGAGVADLKVDHTTTSRIDTMWQDLIDR